MIMRNRSASLSARGPARRAGLPCAGPARAPQRRSRAPRAAEVEDAVVEDASIDAAELEDGKAAASAKVRGAGRRTAAAAARRLRAPPPPRGRRPARALRMARSVHAELNCARRAPAGAAPPRRPVARARGVWRAAAAAAPRAHRTPRRPRPPPPRPSWRR
jgi:hypothetical protein